MNLEEMGQHWPFISIAGFTLYGYGQSHEYVNWFSEPACLVLFFANSEPWR